MREQEVKLERVKKSCSTAKKVAKVFKILAIVFAVMCFLSAGFLFAFKGQVNEAIAQENEINPNSITIDKLDIESGVFKFDMDENQIAESGEYAQAFALVCIMGGIVLTIVAVIFGFIQKIFVTIEVEDSPFSEKVLKTVKRLFIGIAVVMGLGIGIGIGLFLALFFWCLYCILDYGFELQKEIDETL